MIHSCPQIHSTLSVQCCFLSGEVEQAVANLRGVHGQMCSRENGAAAVRAAQSVERCRSSLQVNTEGETEGWDAWVEHSFGPDASRYFEFLHLGLLKPLGFSSPVLEPDLDLRLGQRQGGGELGPLGNGQVLLLTELSLQGQELRGGEGSARLTVGFVLSQGADCWTELS